MNKPDYRRYIHVPKQRWGGEDGALTLVEGGRRRVEGEMYMFMC